MELGGCHRSKTSDLSGPRTVPADTIGARGERSSVLIDERFMLLDVGTICMRRRDYLAGATGAIGLAVLSGTSAADTTTPRFHVMGDGLGVSINRTNAPVQAGERLEVMYSVGSGTEPTRDVVRLLAGDEIVAAETWDLEAEATVTDALQYPTFRTNQDVTFDVTLMTHRDQDSTTVTVEASE